MIPPVDKDLGVDDDDRDAKDILDYSGPRWIKWDFTKWASATQMMDSEQRGWYISLLSNAALQGTPLGYLPDDEDELMYLAGIKDLDADALRKSKRWLRVLSKFRKSTEFPGYVYNRMLVRTIREANIKSKFTREAANSRWGKDKKKKNLDADALLIQSESNAAGLSISKSLSSLNPTEEDTKKVLRTEEEEKSLSVTVPAKKNRGLPETLFDESQFIITDKMKTFLTEKYPAFDDGDWALMAEKFCNVYYGTRHRSWSRCFYKFVSNQLTQYNYHPGDYTKRQQQKGSGSHVNLQPQSKFESAAERNARNNREAERYTAELRSRGQRPPTENSPGLPLTTDDD